MQSHISCQTRSTTAAHTATSQTVGARRTVGGKRSSPPLLLQQHHAHCHPPVYLWGRSISGSSIFRSASAGRWAHMGVYADKLAQHHQPQSSKRSCMHTPHVSIHPFYFLRQVHRSNASELPAHGQHAGAFGCRMPAGPSGFGCATC